MLCLMSAVELVRLNIWFVHLKALGIELICSYNTSRENQQNVFTKKSWIHCKTIFLKRSVIIVIILRRQTFKKINLPIRGTFLV